MKPRFSIGYNFDLESFLQLISAYNKHIDSVYFPIPRKYLGSGRILDEPPRYEKEVIELIKRCRGMEITPFMILNSTIVSASGIISVLSYTKRLHENGLLNHATVTDPYLMMQIRKEMPGMFVEASTLCRIRTVQEAKYFRELGVSRITSCRETIRDMKLLKEICGVLPVKVMANEGCIKNCVYRFAHYNMLSANVDEQPLLPFGDAYRKRKRMMEEMDGMCVFTVSRHPHKVFSAPLIRPEDLKRYRENSAIILKCYSMGGKPSCYWRMNIIRWDAASILLSGLPGKNCRTLCFFPAANAADGPRIPSGMS